MNAEFTKIGAVITLWWRRSEPITHRRLQIGLERSLTVVYENKFYVFFNMDVSLGSQISQRSRCAR